MPFHAALADDESTTDAADSLIASAAQSNLSQIDIAFLFFTAHHASEADALLEKISAELNPDTLVGCSAEGVIGPDREIERAPGAALLIAQLPGVNIHPFHIPRDDWRALFDDPDQLIERLGVGDQTKSILAFGDPFTTPTLQLLPLLNQICPRIPLSGGMASAAHAPGENVLIYNNVTLDEGLVGVSLSGQNLDVQTIVSQGCRPFGKPFVITKSKDNVIQTLGGRPALQALRDAILDMPPADRQLLENGLFVGRAISEYKETFDRGDFLVRNVMSVDNDSGAIAIADFARTGQTIRFHVRDAATATEDLNEMLNPEKLHAPSPAGALLFSCNGRGTRLFEKPSHDVQAANRAIPNTPIAGFFAAGELGPVSGENFIHGHTASFALFRSKH